MIHALWLAWHTHHAIPQFCALALGSHPVALIAQHCAAHVVAEGGIK